MSDSAAPFNVDTLVDDFWAFALAVYAQPGVEHLCLRMQNQNGMDVTLALMLLWLNWRGLCVSESQLKALLAHIEPFRCEALAKLRGIRAFLKESPYQSSSLAGLRRQVLQVELEAERVLAYEILQYVLQSDMSCVVAELGRVKAVSLVSLTSNIHRYTELLGVDDASESVTTLARAAEQSIKHLVADVREG